MTSTSRAIAALVEIMRDTEQAPRRRIEACEHLLDYECPLEVIDEGKAVLMSIVEDSEVLVDIKLDANAISAVNAMKANGMAIPSVCITQREKVTTEQVRDVVVRDLAAHPETGHQTAAGHALLRLQAAFPCK